MDAPEDEASFDVMDPRFVGVLGFSFYAILFLAVSFQLKHHLTKGDFRLTLRKSFHTILWMYALLEALSYIPMAFEGATIYTKPFYIMHLLAISCDITAFSLVTVLWSRTLTLTPNERRFFSSSFPFVLITADAAFLVYSVFVCFDIVRYRAEQTNEEVDLDTWAKSSPSYKHLLIAEPCALSFNALCVIVYGAKMVYKLVSLRNWPTLPRQVQLRILTQTFFTMFSCAFCYLLRSLMLVLEYSRIERSDSLMDTNAAWWFGAIWIPTIVPSCLLLFTMRNLDKAKVSQVDFS